MTIMYHDGNRRLQDQFDSRRISDRLEEKLTRTAFTADDKAFIESAIYFFMSTADAEGPAGLLVQGRPAGLRARHRPTTRSRFPDYDGNGMFKSLGNLLVNPNVGLLFIDLHERPRRLRVNGSATVSREDPLLGETVGAQLIVRVKARAIFPNCPRYIPKMQLTEPSVYVPQPGCDPVEPAWKGFDLFKGYVHPRQPTAKDAVGPHPEEPCGAGVSKDGTRTARSGPCFETRRASRRSLTHEVRRQSPDACYRRPGENAFDDLAGRGAAMADADRRRARALGGARPCAAAVLRAFMRRRFNRAIEDLNTRLKLRIQPFKLAKRQALIDQLIFDPEVLRAVEAYAAENKVPREVAQQRARRYAQEIVPSFSAYAYFGIGTRLARWVSTFLYRVRLGYMDESAMTTVDPDSAVIFVINHRSNMDYVLVTYMASSSSALSYAVGEWARVWLLQNLIRSMGAYFVRRDSREPLYRKVLSRYVHLAIAGGLTQAMFPEGGLTRDGKLRPPKLGLLELHGVVVRSEGAARRRVRARSASTTTA